MQIVEYIVDQMVDNVIEDLEIFIAKLNPDAAAMLTNSDCHRFIRARKGDIEKAVEMANAWSTWWITDLPGIDPPVCPRDILNELEDPHEHVYKELVPHSNMGEDKDGHPVYWDATGRISSNFAKLMEHITMDELMWRHIRQQVKKNVCASFLSFFLFL